jgi:hypothetical protein
LQFEARPYFGKKHQKKGWWSGVEWLKVWALSSVPQEEKKKRKKEGKKGRKKMCLAKPKIKKTQTFKKGTNNERQHTEDIWRFGETVIS